ncbi:MAG: YraN family protein [Patescibacteria group bacterium]|nr:YraN family protein [Patescibacteria group bacterium]
MSIAKLNTKKIGDLGEDIACDFLTSNNYKIIIRNYRSRYGEIDIIALDQKDDFLVFVEVKKKTSDRFGEPSEMINERKIKKIIATAEFFLQENKLDNCQTRVDAILINNKGLEHIKDITT